MKHTILKDYDNYIIYENGSIWSIKNKRFLKPYIGAKGYNIVTLCCQGKRKAAIGYIWRYSDEICTNS